MKTFSSEPADASSSWRARFFLEGLGDDGVVDATFPSSKLSMLLLLLLMLLLFFFLKARRKQFTAALMVLFLIFFNTIKKSTKDTPPLINKKMWRLLPKKNSGCSSSFGFVCFVDVSNVAFSVKFDRCPDEKVFNF